MAYTQVELSLNSLPDSNRSNQVLYMLGEKVHSTNCDQQRCFPLKSRTCIHDVWWWPVVCVCCAKGNVKKRAKEREKEKERNGLGTVFVGMDKMEKHRHSRRSRRDEFMHHHRGHGQSVEPIDERQLSFVSFLFLFHSFRFFFVILMFFC